MVGLVAAFALNFWLFRLGFLYGFIGLNITKHLVIAAFCQNLGRDGRAATLPDPRRLPAPHASRRGNAV